MKKYIFTAFAWTILVTFQFEVVARPPLRIINGTDAEEGEFPYLVQLLLHNSDFKCEGSIIGPKWILTGGYCVDGTTIAAIVYGTNQLYDKDGFPDTSIKVKSSFLHPKYQPYDSPNGFMFDVALLQLEEEIPFYDVVSPVTLAENNNDIPHHIDGVLAGWGFNITDGHLVPYLQKNTLQLLTDEECTQIIDDVGKGNIFNATHFICTNDYYTGQCVGDSGSPFVIDGIQYGITSWGLDPCGESPGAYSRITNPEYREWIRSVSGI